MNLYVLLRFVLIFTIVTSDEATDSHDGSVILITDSYDIARMVASSVVEAIRDHNEAKMTTIDAIADNNINEKILTVGSSVKRGSHGVTNIAPGLKETILATNTEEVLTGSHDEDSAEEPISSQDKDSAEVAIGSHDKDSAEVMTGSHDEAEMEIRKLDARSKRQINTLPLVFPYGGVYRLILGFTTPIHNLENVNFVMLCGILYQYVQFQNITQLSQYYVYNTVSREERAAEWESRKDERLVLYKAAEDMMSSKGLNGHECVLRAICEAAQYPVKDEGLIGELMHILLTPNYGRTEFDAADPDWEASMSAYTSAYAAGRQMFSCSYIYSLCPEGVGLLDLVTVLRNQ